MTPLDSRTFKKSYLKDFSCEAKKAVLFSLDIIKMSCFKKIPFKVFSLARLKLYTIFLRRSGPIAQLVEQLTFNQLVPRSSRGRPTIFSLIFVYCTT